MLFSRSDHRNSLEDKRLLGRVGMEVFANQCAPGAIIRMNFRSHAVGSPSLPIRK